ncbi:hypothetical protein NBRC111894_310 [Sporolactobacillus inulinus]|uniref:Uncharacterized protein n=1 Tax=Sporolactobacillus inulinus TaxID=2078 RepID=A0A4Y1Z765_9BACL|nr:hypothetical protein NBRC111894_310 [Sporolactobacillus inulinus]
MFSALYFRPQTSFKQIKLKIKTLSCQINFHGIYFLIPFSQRRLIGTVSLFIRLDD